MTDQQAGRYDGILRLFLLPDGYSKLGYNKEDDDLTTDQDLIFLESQNFITLIKTVIRIYSAHITQKGIEFIKEGGFTALKANGMADVFNAGTAQAAPVKPMNNGIFPKEYSKFLLAVLLIIITWIVLSKILFLR